MLCTKFIVILLVKSITCSFNESQMEHGYRGQIFPIKYLTINNSDISASDIDHYLKSLKAAVDYFNVEPNDTDVNTALGVFVMKSTLIRTLLDSGKKLQMNQIKSLKQVINVANNILSHYIYLNYPYGWEDLEYRVSKLFKLDAALVYSLGEFNRGKLTEWILTNKNNVNNFLEDMDSATLTRDKYAKLINDMKNYNIKINTSDYCMGLIEYLPDQVNVTHTQLRKCINDEYCERNVYSTPSIGYSLSHRLLNVQFRVYLKRCYLRTEHEDKQLMDQLCANMYREAVYIARRGFFTRDLFMEHITLCGLLGYEEFFRKNWFYKATSWLTQHGCVPENWNLVLNYTKTLLKVTGSAKQREQAQQTKCRLLHKECDHHVSALFVAMLGHAVRHAAYFFKVIT